jgi:hypothetical protein
VSYFGGAPMSTQLSKQILERTKELMRRFDGLSRIEFFVVVMAVLCIGGIYFVKSETASISIPIFILALVWTVIFARAKQID